MCIKFKSPFKNFMHSFRKEMLWKVYDISARVMSICNWLYNCWLKSSKIAIVRRIKFITFLILLLLYILYVCIFYMHVFHNFFKMWRAHFNLKAENVQHYETFWKINKHNFTNYRHKLNPSRTEALKLLNLHFY